jgi:hypothetical protein
MPAQLGKSLCAGNVAPVSEGAFGRVMKVVCTPRLSSTKGIAVDNKTKKETFRKIRAAGADRSRGSVSLRCIAQRLFG